MNAVAATTSPMAPTAIGTAIADWKLSSVGAPPELLTTAATAASPTAPPTWNEVFSRPDASPCSWSATPAVAWMFSDGNLSAKPVPISSIVGNISPT